MSANDIVDAAVQKLRATSAVTSAFGDTWNPSTSTGTIKFFADYASDFALPYLVIFEIGETFDYMTQSPLASYADLINGQLGIAIFQTGRIAARQLGFLVAAALNDAALTWTGNTLMMLRLAAARFIPVTEVAPASPTTFQRFLTFSYEYSGAIA